MDVRSVGICVKPEQAQLADLVRELEKWLVERGLEVVPDPDAGRWTGAAGTPRGELAGRADLIVVLGGDGTLLAVARAVGERDVPILGVNLGTLGYLVETHREELFPNLEAVLSGRFRVEERMRLDVRVDRGVRSLGRYIALYDAVISNAALSRMVLVETHTLLDVQTSIHDGLERVVELLLGDLREKAQGAQVDAEDRYLAFARGARYSEQRSIAPEHDDEIDLFRELVAVKALAARDFGGLSAEYHGVTALRKPLLEVLDHAPQLGLVGFQADSN